jgi:raffinose/stachyose/melibiose transport system substrate-binding protein
MKKNSMRHGIFLVPLAVVLSVFPVSQAWAKGQGAKPGSINLEIVTNAQSPVLETFASFFDEFARENPNIKIDFSSQSGDYEQLMKARMASGDLPDMFATHGWSVERYSEYLRPLNDQPWFSTIEESFLPIIQNAKGEIFVLPFDMDRNALMYNKSLLTELGVEVPQTLAEFLDICKKGKEKGYTGVFIAGKDNRQPAFFLDVFAIPFLVSPKDRNFAAQLTNGTFDWNEWAPVSKLLQDLSKNGYLNVDAGTCDPIDIPARFAENKVLFFFAAGPGRIIQVKEIAPGVDIRMAPIPAVYGNDRPSFSGGERQAFGIWKDTKHEEACLKVLAFLSRPEIVKRLCEASGNLPAIKGVRPNFPATLIDDYAKYANVPIYPIFDRVYLPSGMWSTMRTTGSALVAGEISVQEAVNSMRENYKTLRQQMGL